MDLNLLRVFDILMEVRSVSRAAERLGLTQSAVSHALGRLRTQLDDPLFARAGSGLRPTPRALEIAPSIKDGLSLLRDAFSSPTFTPASATRTFTISASSYFCVTLLPIVIQLARAEAPLARFRVVAPPNALVAELDEGGVDLALGAYGRTPGRLVRKTLFTERLVWVGRPDAARPDPATRPMLSIAPVAPASSLMMMRSGLELRVGPTEAAARGGESYLAIHDALSAGAFISSSDLVALLPWQLAKRITADRDIAMLDSDSGERLELSMLWHGRSASDLAHIWLRGVVEAATATLIA